MVGMEANVPAGAVLEEMEGEFAPDDVCLVGVAGMGAAGADSVSAAAAAAAVGVRWVAGVGVAGECIFSVGLSALLVRVRLLARECGCEGGRSLTLPVTRRGSSESTDFEGAAAAVADGCCVPVAGGGVAIPSGDGVASPGVASAGDSTGFEGDAGAAAAMDAYDGTAGVGAGTGVFGMHARSIRALKCLLPM